MTRLEVRQALADAASAVEGITCTPYGRQTTKAGDAMVRLDRMDRDDSGFGFMVTWQVAVVLPQDQAKAEQFIDAKTPALIEALADHMVVTDAAQVQLVLEHGSLPVLIVSGAREEESS
jgi:hypothetical protein